MALTNLPWRQSIWGDEISLEYGKSLRDYALASGPVRVYGSNGPIGYTDKALAEGPGVILGRKGAYRGVEYSKGPFFVIDTAYYVVPKTALDMRWIYYAVQHYKLGELDDGSPIPSTTRSAVYVRDLDVPDIAEQKAIAAMLSILDDKIELNRRTNATLEAMARALFKSWFVDFDPVRAKMEGRKPYGLAADLAALFPERFSDEIPAGWREDSIYSCAEFINGAAYKNMHFSNAEDAFPVVKIAELKNGIGQGTKFTNTNLGNKYLIDTGEILFSWSGSPETSIDTFLWINGKAWLNQHIFRVVTKSKEERVFTFFLLKHLKPIFIDTAKDKQTTGLGHVTVQDLKRLKAVYPSQQVLRAFSDVATPFLDSIQKNLEQIAILNNIRDTLLPKLISGELRVGDAEGALKEAV